ncbi:prohead protease [Providencia phage vB_PreS-PatoteraRojo]|nr:prohead protease [Providencia phage vB_PreS-PatoteraRojo]
MKNHVTSSIAMAIQRMSGTAIAIRENDASFVSNVQTMMSCEDDDYHEKAELQMRKDLCSAYGMGEPSADKPFAFSGGLAIIPIHGTLINRYGGYYYGYVTGYNFIRSQRNAALADPDVKAIIYDVNSNGGEAAGCFELSKEMRETRGDKPSLAVVDSNCYSAAYALASAAGKIAVTPSGGAGSIGVVAMHIDMSEMLDNIGIKISLIKSGEHKTDGSPFEPLSDSAKKSWQESVDTMRTEFVDLVAENRNLDPKVVRDTEAECYSAKDAQALGLIDEVATPSAAVTELLNGTEASSEQPGALAMSFTQEEMDTAKKEAATAERSRISGIIGCDAAKNRSTLANHIAFNTSMSVEDAGTMLAASAEETPAPAPAAPAPAATAPAAAPAASPFNTVMSSAEHPEAGADAGAEAEATAQPDGLMAAMSQVAGNQMSKGA